MAKMHFTTSDREYETPTCGFTLIYCCFLWRHYLIICFLWRHHLIHLKSNQSSLRWNILSQESNFRPTFSTDVVRRHLSRKYISFGSLVRLKCPHPNTDEKGKHNYFQYQQQQGTGSQRAKNASKHKAMSEKQSSLHIK